MDFNEISRLVRLVQKSDITELEYAEGDHKVRISRQFAVAPMMAMSQMTAPIYAPAPAAQPATTASASNESPATNDAHVVKSPMVGTFYRAASPDMAPFVSEGSLVKKGDALCIIEAMKLMNEIEAEYDGRVEKILAANATAVEYGQPMFVITPA